MSGGTHAERIIELLAQWPGLDDDEIAKALCIEPRQTINQICRRLAERGVVTRARGSNGKIVNRLCDGGPAPDLRLASAKSATAIIRSTAPVSGDSLVPADVARTLLVIPCSKAKQTMPAASAGEEAITNHLSTELAAEFSQARRRIRSRLAIDESTLVPAWQRYDGSLYRTARGTLSDLRHKGCHIIILSGGYGAVLADEPIGMYNAALKPSWWPDRILERVLIAYAKHHGLTSVRAFASATSAYRRVLQRIPWQGEGIDDALLLTPDAEPGGTLRSPASLGEALCALSAGRLTTGWKSSYGLGLSVHSC